MLENIKVYTTDKYWNHIFSDLGMVVVDSPKIADVVFDDVDMTMPVSISELQAVILNKFENKDIICAVFGHDVVLSKLQHKIIVILYKNPNITMNELKDIIGVLPNVTTHAVENAVYQLRKLYGYDIIQNIDGKYKIGHV